MKTWKQTFQADDGTVLSGASVSVYLAGSSIAARVFDVNSDLHDTVPQLTTDIEGFIEFSLDEDDYMTTQLFDIKIECQYLCQVQNIVELKSIKILQDTEGGLEFKRVFLQNSEPDESTLNHIQRWGMGSTRMGYSGYFKRWRILNRSL